MISSEQYADGYEGVAVRKNANPFGRGANVTGRAARAATASMKAENSCRLA